MKTRITILLLLCLLLTACDFDTSTQEIEVVTEAPITEVPPTEETAVTETEETTEEAPTEAPTEPPLACVTLLAPLEDANIPTVGKVTFSWTPMDEAGLYILNIILPSGEVVSFETDQAFHDRYMEAFVAGGEYQWNVIVQDLDGTEICVSEVASFDKPAYAQPKGNGNDGSGGGDDDKKPGDGTH